MKKKIAVVCVLLSGLTACSGKKDHAAEYSVQMESVSVATEDMEQGSSEIQETQQNQNHADGNLEERLAQYRLDREAMTNVAMGSGVSGYGAPNSEDYGLQTDTADYLLGFDSRELNKAYETAEKYVEETLAVSVETKAIVYPCVDPRITGIYEAKDKGVAEGFDAGNIFVCEYCDNGIWQYLILVRDGKDSDWSVIHHGDSYKE